MFHSKIKIVETFDTPVLEGAIDVDGICHLVYKSNVPINLKTLGDSYDIIEEKMRENTCLVLLDLTPRKETSKELRDYTAMRNERVTKGAALVTNSLMSKLIANLFIRLNKPSFPIQAFQSHSDALMYIRGLLPKE